MLQELWEVARDETSDTSVKARIIGVQAQFRTFGYYFGCQLGFLLLQHSDNLSKTLQSTKLSACEGQRVAAMTVATLQRIRDEGSFDLFWKKVESDRQSPHGCAGASTAKEEKNTQKAGRWKFRR